MKRPGKYPQLADEEWLREQYVSLQKSTIIIAEDVGCSAATVQVRLNQAGIKMRGRWSCRWNLQQCVRCGKMFAPSGPAAKYCSPECRLGTMNCEQCGAEFALKPPRNIKKDDGTWTSYKRRFCSHECLTAWRGENCAHRWVNSEGYVEMTVEPTWHRDVDSAGYARINLGTGKLSEGRVKEHRWVMEQRLGRPLLPNEEIHHKNAVRTDNDRCPDCPTRTPPPKIVNVAGKERLLCETCGWQSQHTPNLELWDGSQPRGGRVTDKIAWALEFLSQYGKVKFTPGVVNPQADAPSAEDVTALF